MFNTNLTKEQIKRLIERVKSMDDVQLINDNGKLNYGDVYDFDWAPRRKHDDELVPDLLQKYRDGKQE